MNRTACNDLADYVWLTGGEAGQLLSGLAAEEKPLHTLVARLRRDHSAERTHLLLEQVELRRRAAAKFTRAAQLFFTRVGLEQATDEWVADYKAKRVASGPAGPSARPGSPRTPSSIVDLCCGIGGDLTALVQRGEAFGVDIDPVAALFAAANSGARVETVDAAQMDMTGIAAFHIDPDRRSSGHRTTSFDFFQPSLETVERLLSRVPNAAVKLAPATEVPANWAEHCELEWISRNRECKQLVAWHGALADALGKHRATIVDKNARDLATCSVIGLPKQPFPLSHEVNRHIFDVDPAVLAAHLTGVIAAEHGLAGLNAGPTYLTGPNALNDAALACFEVDDVLPFDPRQLACVFADRKVGELEIKRRGVDIDPEKLRRELKLRGDNAATLLLTRVGGRPTAIIAKRV